MTSSLTNPSRYLGSRERRVGRTVDGNYIYHGVVIRHGKPMVIVWPDGDEQSATSLTYARNQIDDALAREEHGLVKDTPVG